MRPNIHCLRSLCRSLILLFESSHALIVQLRRRRQLTAEQTESNRMFVYLSTNEWMKLGRVSSRRLPALTDILFGACMQT